ncbi:MAG: hypothetical protein AAGJ87_05245, partial [Pseudomonadota bacterium]
AGAKSGGVFFVAPYGYYYEMIILALPVAVLAKRGLESGWLKWEPATIAVMFALPMAMPGTAAAAGVSWGFPAIVLIAAGVSRRIVHEYPQTVAPLISGFARWRARRADA